MAHWTHVTYGWNRVSEHGGPFKPGPDPRRGPGSRAKSFGRAFRERAQASADAILDAFIALALDPAEQTKDRVAAGKIVIEHAHGRPVQAVNISGELDTGEGTLRGDSDLLAKFERLLAAQALEKDALAAQAPEPEGGSNGTSGNGVH